MATATAISDKQLENEMGQLHSEATSIKKKIADDTRALEAALAERERVTDRIALGTAKESRRHRSKRRSNESRCESKATIACSKQRAHGSMS